MDLNDRFDALDENLKLDPRERKRAITIHNRLGDLLVTAGVAKRTRLQGSFARKTMLPPLHDIDKIVELVDALRDLLAGPDGPRRAMRMIRDALAPHLRGARFEVKKHALTITLPGEGFGFDAVPAFNPEDGSGWIMIADTEDRDWEPSNTYLLIDTIGRRNQECGGQFVHQVRMVKQAVRIAGLDDVLPGLHTETFAYNAITRRTPHPDAVAAAFAAAARLLGATYTDPTGADVISERLDPADVEKAQSGMQRLADSAVDALRLAEAGDEEGAAQIWADIFGDAFPRPKQAEKDYLARLYGGAGVDSSGRTSSQRRTPRTRPWRPL
ncbi:MAG: SMODS domain-containing nucleotidyltransferase [Acidimicrobiia bacterium]